MCVLRHNYGRNPPTHSCTHVAYIFKTHTPGCISPLFQRSLLIMTKLRYPATKSFPKLHPLTPNQLEVIWTMNHLQFHPSPIISVHRNLGIAVPYPGLLLMKPHVSEYAKEVLNQSVSSVSGKIKRWFVILFHLHNLWVPKYHLSPTSSYTLASHIFFRCYYRSDKLNQCRERHRRIRIWTAFRQTVMHARSTERFELMALGGFGCNQKRECNLLIHEMTLVIRPVNNWVGSTIPPTGRIRRRYARTVLGGVYYLRAWSRASGWLRDTESETRRSIHCGWKRVRWCLDASHSLSASMVSTRALSVPPSLSLCEVGTCSIFAPNRRVGHYNYLFRLPWQNYDRVCLDFWMSCCSGFLYFLYVLEPTFPLLVVQKYNSRTERVSDLFLPFIRYVKSQARQKFRS